MLRVNVPLDPTKTGREAEVLDTNLRKLIVGQDEAIEQIVNIYQMYLTGMTAPGRPIANLLFLGPTGSGKTRIVEATAESLVKNARAVLKIDCAEFQHSHEIAKLIGSPPWLSRAPRDAPAIEPGSAESVPYRHYESELRAIRRNRKGQ
jgi:ATP-dependent Clp protease ATP-binding subunit ClpA